MPACGRYGRPAGEAVAGRRGNGPQTGRSVPANATGGRGLAGSAALDLIRPDLILGDLIRPNLIRTNLI